MTESAFVIDFVIDVIDSSKISQIFTGSLFSVRVFSFTSFKIYHLQLWTFGQTKLMIRRCYSGHVAIFTFTILVIL